MSALTDAARAQRCDTIASLAGWVAFAGVGFLIAGLLAEFGLYDARFGVLGPVGILLLVPAGIVCILADNLASRYREPADEDADL